MHDRAAMSPATGDAATAQQNSHSPMKTPVVPAVPPQEQQKQATQHARPQRLYFIDWLRVVLTVLVVVQHCFNTMRPDGGDLYW